MYYYNLIHGLKTENITSTAAEFSLKLLEPAQLQVDWGLKGRPLRESIYVSEDNFNIQDKSISFQIQGLNPAQEYSFRVTALPEYITSQNISAEKVGDAPLQIYGFFMRLITDGGLEIMNLGYQSTGHGPQDFDEDNYIILSWEPVPKVAEYEIYEYDPIEEAVYVVGRTSQNHIIYNGRTDDNLLQVDDLDEWFDHEPKNFPLHAGESGRYDFVTKS